MNQTSGKPSPTCLLGKSLYVGNYYVTVQKKLGEGGFATIYQAVHRHHQGRDGGQFFALKHFRINGDLEKLNSVKRECLLMNNVKKHPHIVTLFAACFAGSPIATDGFFLMELCHQDLVKALTANHRHMTETDILGIFLQVAQGVSHMHSQSPPLAHWDLKAENVLQSLSGSWVVCDFGSATTIDEVPQNSRIAALEDTVRRNTTAAYRAPELYDLHNGYRVNTQVDIFALGVLLYLMCFSKFPFQADAKAMVLKGNFVIPPNRHRPETCQLISRMLIVDPSRRPNIHEVISCTQNLLASPGPAPVSPPPHGAAPNYPQPGPQPGPQPNAMPHAAMGGYPSPVVPQQPHSPMHAPPVSHPYPVPPVAGFMNAHGPGGMVMHGSPAAASPIAIPPGGGGPSGWSGMSAPPDASGHAPADPFPAAPVAVGSAPATGASRGISGGSAVRDPFAASEQFDHSTGSRPSSMHATGEPGPGEVTATRQTTVSAPVSPAKRMPQGQQQPFGAGAHTSDGVRKATGDAQVGSAAAAAEAKKRVLPSSTPKHPQDAGQPGAVVSPRAAEGPGSPTGKVQPVSSFPVTGVSDAVEDLGGSDRHPAVAGMKQSSRLTARKAKAAAYAAMSGVDGEGVDDGDVDGVASAMSQLRIENERLRSELAARMAGGAAGGTPVEAAKDEEEKEELVRKLRTTEEELEQRRLQVGEMRSIIDAICVTPPAGGAEVPAQPPVADGDGGARSPAGSGSRGLSPKKNGNSMTRQRTGFQEVSQRVWAILNETAGWQRSGLRRSVSEVHVAWSEFDEDSPLHP